MNNEMKWRQFILSWVLIILAVVFAPDLPFQLGVLAVWLGGVGFSFSIPRKYFL